MDLAFSLDQSVLFEAFEQFFRRESPSAVVRRSEPLGFDADLWALFNTMEVWGSDATLADLSVIAEAVGRSIAPVPFVDHAVVARLLSWPDLVSGVSIGSMSLRPCDSRGVWPLVPCGAVADVVVGMHGDEFVAVSAPAPQHAQRNHACAPLADRSASLGERIVIGGRDEFDVALAEWKTLTAATLAGIAAEALDMAVEYVKERHQFGVPIGSFQSVQHGLADLPGRIDGARLLVHQAASGLDPGIAGVCDAATDDITDGRALASMALLFAGDVARDVTDRSLHFHGGYGFAEEYDIQLYYRRARGWALVLGDPAAQYLELADRLWPSQRTTDAMAPR